MWAMTKSVIIFFMAATGAALHTGPGAGERFAAPMEAPASSEAGKGACGDGDGDGQYDLGEDGTPKANAGKNCAYDPGGGEAAGTKSPGNNTRTRCCCYHVPTSYFSLFGESPKCFLWSDQDIKASIADSKMEHHLKRMDDNEVETKGKPGKPLNEHRGFSAIKELVSDPGWCPDVDKSHVPESPWCPFWYTRSIFKSPEFPVKAAEGMCKPAPKLRPIEKCIDTVDLGDGYKYTAVELAEKVDFEYEEDEMCCCYRYRGLYGNFEKCYRMFHEDVVYVQDRLRLFKDRKDGKGKEAMGLEKEEVTGKYKCPKAHWKSSWEIMANGVTESLDAPLEYFGVKDQDHKAADFSYPCPTSGVHSKEMTNLFTFVGAICAWVSHGLYGSTYDEFLEPSNTPDKCPVGEGEEWQPRLCY